MNRICWWAVDFLSRLLEAEERNAVRGDFAESGESGGQALWGILGLVVRRQAALWKGWQPWLALLGVIGVTALVLSEIAFQLDVGLALQLRTYLRYGVHYETGVTPGQDVIYLACVSVALFLWSWTGGFVLASLSGRATWPTWALFYIVVLESFQARLFLSGAMVVKHSPAIPLIVLAALLPLSISKIVFLLAALWGATQGVRLRTLEVRQTFTLALAIAIVISLLTWTSGWYEAAHEIWSGGVWRAVPWPTRLLPFACGSWPAVYMLATSWHRQRTQADKPTANDFGDPNGYAPR